MEYTQNWKEVYVMEEMGWDYLWRDGGHFSTQGSMDPQPLLLSAAIASRTHRIKTIENTAFYHAMRWNVENTTRYGG